MLSAAFPWAFAAAPYSTIRLVTADSGIASSKVPRELDPAAAGLIRASLTGDKFATDRILTRSVEADLDGLFFAFTMANLAGRVLAYARQ
jgi:hypothetical protein